jgi:5-methylcytosine-specific restriction enzyme subunit McrC
MLWVSEHGRIFKGEANRTLENGNLELNKKDFVAFLSLLEDQDDEAADYEPIFSYIKPRGVDCLKVQNYVGVVRTESGTQVEILPKLAKKTTPKSARKLLVKMLMHLEDSPFREGTAANLEAHKMPLFELLMRYFLDHVATIARKGIARTYVAHQDNLVFLRGKLQLKEHIRRNSVNSARCFCEYDEYEINRPINRLIKGALVIVSRLTRDATNQQRCRELLFWFDNVPPTQSPALDFQRMQKDRLIQHYAPAMPICRLILEGLNPLTQQGERKAVSMLFPMERVFEDFVAAKLVGQFEYWNVSTQVRGKSLVQRHIDRRMFNLIPDLELSRAGTRLIADTKWKLLDQSDRSGRYNISQADIYQLFAYSRKYLAGQSTREVYLIYPASDTFTKPLRAFWYDDGKEVLHVVPYDLVTEQLVLPKKHCALNELALDKTGSDY